MAASTCSIARRILEGQVLAWKKIMISSFLFGWGTVPIHRRRFRAPVRGRFRRAFRPLVPRDSYSQVPCQISRSRATPVFIWICADKRSDARAQKCPINRTRIRGLGHVLRANSQPRVPEENVRVHQGVLRWHTLHGTESLPRLDVETGHPAGTVEPFPAVCLNASMDETDRLAEFAILVRESSVKRLVCVAPGDEAWRPREDMLSFVDHLWHLTDADKWLLNMLSGKPRPRPEVRPGDAKAEDWDRLLGALVQLGRDKAEFIRSVQPDDLGRSIRDPEVLGDTTWWWLIVRANLDHEIHHRGAIQISLRLRYGSDVLPRREP